MYFEYDAARTYNYDNGPKSSPVTTVMFEGSEWEELKAKTDLPGGTAALCIDYAELDSSLKNEIGGKVLVYAPIKKKWFAIGR